MTPIISINDADNFHQFDNILCNKFLLKFMSAWVNKPSFRGGSNSKLAEESFASRNDNLLPANTL